MTETARANSEIDDPVNAFTPHTPPVIEGAPEGPLSGLTFAVKDLYDIAGYKTGGGSPEWLETHEAATATAPTVQKCLDAGATMIGKTVCDELFYAFFGENAHYGTPLNSAAPRRVPGGSSSGSAAAVAAGMCDFALGSDTGGSVRIPAAFCGLFGLRPTHGRVDLTHGMAMAPSFDTGGWFTRDIDTFRRVGAILLDDRSTPSEIDTVLVGDFAFDHADAHVTDPLRTFIEVARRNLPGRNSVSDMPDGITFAEGLEAFRVIQGYETWQSFGAWADEVQPDLGPGIKQRMAAAKQITAAERDAQLPYRDKVAAAFRKLLPPGTVMVMPVAADLPPRLNMDPKLADPFRAKTMSIICLSSLSGLPQISIPVAYTHDMPVGLAVMGWEGGDEALMALAKSLSHFV